MINAEIRRRLTTRQSQDPGRYSRPIDAALLEDEICILCNPQLWKEHFEPALREAYPLGPDHARFHLGRLIAPRNALSHANTVSLRAAEQVVCYANVTLDSLKRYYAEKAKENEYDVPRILRIRDSLGHEVCAPYDHAKWDHPALHVGDVVVLEAEVDTAYPPDAYDIQWLRIMRPIGSGPVLRLEIRATDVGERLPIFCRIVSKRNWHRHNGYDDQVWMAYKVLPPPES